MPTVEVDVAFGIRDESLPVEEVRKRVMDALSKVGMQDYAKVYAPLYFSFRFSCEGSLFSITFPPCCLCNLWLAFVITGFSPCN